jgi:hypothetical protein
MKRKQSVPKNDLQIIAITLTTKAFLRAIIKTHPNKHDLIAALREEAKTTSSYLHEIDDAQGTAVQICRDFFSDFSDVLEY